jgi:NhaP-type Na+/H+ or K+/H+ antiporter
MSGSLTSSQIFIGIGLTFGLAMACQVTATKLRFPAIVLLLPAGFIAGTTTSDINPYKLFGSAFTPMVSLAVAVILFNGGLDLDFTTIEGGHRRVVRRLLAIGVPLTWAAASFFAALLLGLSTRIAIMLGVILIVSGPTVVTPILELARPRQHVRTILTWEGTWMDPIGAVLGVVTYQIVKSSSNLQLGDLGTGILHFIGRMALGFLAAAVALIVLWVLLHKVKLSGPLAAQVVLAVVVVTAAVTNAIRDECGLVAAVTIGIVMVNSPIKDAIPRYRPFFETIVQLVIGLLFISISATVTPASLQGLVWPTVGLVACLVVLVRPVVTVLSTARRGLTTKERAFIAMMDPRGIVAASTAATFSAPLIAAKFGGADKLLPVTFLVIMFTVLLYGLSATPVVRALGLNEPENEPAPRTDARESVDGGEAPNQGASSD